MKDNFDCTQFITFDYESSDDIKKVICDLFGKSIFTVLNDCEICEVKKEFFQ